MKIAVWEPQYPDSDIVRLASGDTYEMADGDIIFEDGRIFEPYPGGDGAIYIGQIDPVELESIEFYDECRARVEGDVIEGYRLVDES